MKLSILILIILFFCNIYSYNLNDFVGVNYTNMGLDISPRIHGAYHHETFSPGEYNHKEMEHEKSLSAGFSLMYTYNAKRNNTIFNDTIFLNPSISYDHSEYRKNRDSLNSSRYSKHENYRFKSNTNNYLQLVSAGLVGNNKIYVTSELYLPIDYYIYASTLYSTSESKYHEKASNEDNRIEGDSTKSTTYSGDLTLSTGIGYGHINQVSEVNLSIFILKELAQKGLLSTHITHSIIEEFAFLLQTLSKKRIYHISEHKKILYLAVDQFFKQKKLLNSYSMEYFAIIYDHLNVITPVRYSGSTLSLQGKTYSGILLSSMQSDPSESRSKLRPRFTSIYGTVNFEYHKAINQFWQFETLHTYSYGNYFQHNNKYNTFKKVWDDNRFDRGTQSAIRSNLSFHYFPSTRSMLTNTLTGFYGYKEGNVKININSNKEKYHNHFFNVSHTSRFKWYFSERLSSTISLTLDYTKEHFTSTLIDESLLSINHSFLSTLSFQQSDPQFQEMYFGQDILDVTIDWNLTYRIF